MNEPHPGRRNSTSNAVSEAEKAYLSKFGIKELFNEVLMQLLLERPEEPVAFIIKAFTKKLPPKPSERDGENESPKRKRKHRRHADDHGARSPHRSRAEDSGGDSQTKIATPTTLSPTATALTPTLAGPPLPGLSLGGRAPEVPALLMSSLNTGSRHQSLRRTPRPGLSPEPAESGARGTPTSLTESLGPVAGRSRSLKRRDSRDGGQPPPSPSISATSPPVVRTRQESSSDLFARRRGDGSPVAPLAPISNRSSAEPTTPTVAQGSSRLVASLPYGRSPTRVPPSDQPPRSGRREGGADFVDRVDRLSYAEEPRKPRSMPETATPDPPPTADFVRRRLASGASQPPTPATPEKRKALPAIPATPAPAPAPVTATGAESARLDEPPSAKMLSRRSSIESNFSIVSCTPSQGHMPLSAANLEARTLSEGGNVGRGLTPQSSISSMASSVSPRGVKLTRTASEISLHGTLKTINQFEVVETIGKGSSGYVYRVRDTGEQDEKGNPTVWAMKVIPRVQRRLRAPGVVKRTFDPLKELAIMKKMDHPNLVKLREVIYDEKAQNVYYILEYLPNAAYVIDLNVHKTGLPLETVRKYMRDVVRGLDYLHKHQIVHLDLKPANLRQDANHVVKILDFGMSRNFESVAEDQLESFTGIGTPAFAAPEFITANKDRLPRGPPVDIWALGVSMFVFLFGKLPFEPDRGLNGYAAQRMLCDLIINSDLRIPPEPPLPPSVQDLLEHLLQKNPESRPNCQQIMLDPWLTRNGEEILTNEGLEDIWVDDDDISGAVTHFTTLRSVSTAVVAARHWRRKSLG